MPNIPNVRVDEVVVHPRDNDLVLATHGYSIWIMDDVTALQQMAAATPTAPTLYKPREAVQWKTDRRNQTEVPGSKSVSYTHLRAHETVLDLVCRLLLEKKKR